MIQHSKHELLLKYGKYSIITHTSAWALTYHITDLHVTLQSLFEYTYNCSEQSN